MYWTYTYFNAGWIEWYCSVMMVCVYASAWWCLFKKDAGSIFIQLTVILYLVAALELYRFWFLFNLLGRPMVGMSAEDRITFYTAWSFRLLVYVVVSLGLLALVASIRKRQQRDALSCPIIGGTAAICAAMILHLHLLSEVHVWRAHQDSHQIRKLDMKCKTLTKRIAEQSVAPLPRDPQPGHSDGEH